MFQKTIKNLSINFNLPNGQNTFASGDLITGNFSFDLTKESNISYITVVVAGKADVHWSRGSGGKRKSRRHYSAKVEFFNMRSTILQNDGGMRRLVEGELCFATSQLLGSWSHSLCVSFAADSRSTRLLPGTHVYPFTCQLPHGCVRCSLRITFIFATALFFFFGFVTDIPKSSL